MRVQTSPPRQPFLGLALAAAIGILAADLLPTGSPGLPLVCFVALFALALFDFLSPISLACYAFVAAGFFCLHNLRTADSWALRTARDLGETPCPVTASGFVVSEPKISPGGSVSFVLHAKSIEIDGALRPCDMKFLARWRHAVEMGDELRLFGTAERPPEARNPGEFDMRSYLARQDIMRELIVRYPENGIVLEREGGPLAFRAAQRSRDWLRTVLSRGLETDPDVTGVINGMILGLRHQTPDDIEEPFQQTGTLHLFAVAGLHVGILARLLWIVATIIRLPRNLAVTLIIPALFFYSAVTGVHTSSLRAATMSAVLLGGFLAERKAFALNSLAAAAALLFCWNTNELFSVGFQLSFSVVAAILLFADPFYGFFRRPFAPDAFLPRTLLSTSRRLIGATTLWLARAGSVSFAAWIGSLPLMLHYFHLATPIALLANLVVVPIAFFVLAGGLMSVIAAPFSAWLSVVFNNTNWLLTKIILGAVHFFAQIPAGHFYLEHPHWPTGALMEINVLDVKSGGAIHVRTGGSDWLFDTGSRRDYGRTVRPYLRSRGINCLDGLVLTHGDAGHLGGASSVWSDFRPAQIIDTTAPDRSPIHRRFIIDLTNNVQQRLLRSAGDEFDLSGDVRARILFPPRGFKNERADDQAMVAQLFVSGQKRVLLMSDSGIATERFLAQHYPDLRSDLIIKGQHYSGGSGSEPFLNAVQPRAIVATACESPPNERIQEEWAQQIAARGIRLFRQDKTGAVRIRIFRDHWEVSSYLSSETFSATSR